jgi:hypothetical protein
MPISTKEELEAHIKANDGRTTLDRELRELFEAFAEARLDAKFKPAFTLVKAQLANLENGQYTPSMLDALATSSFNRANGQGNLKLTDKDRLIFRATLQETFASALKELGRSIRPSAPPSRHSGSFRDSNPGYRRPQPRRPSSPPRTSSSREQLPPWHTHPDTAPAALRHQPPTGNTGMLTEFVPWYIASNEKEPALLAFRYNDSDTRERFMRTFNQCGWKLENSPPFLGFGRTVCKPDWGYVTGTPHYDGFDCPGTCYIDLSTADGRREYSKRQLAPEEIAHARQAVLEILLDEKLISPQIAREAGYNTNSPGALYAKDQITKMRFDEGNRRHGL